MSLTVEVLAEATLAEIGPVTANDSARTSFTLLSGERLLALDASLNVLAEWPAGARHRAHHATDPAQGLALISASDEVRLLDREGRVLWRHGHEEWSGDFESGCAWFDHAGDPYAVVPSDDYNSCLALRFDLASGQVVAETPIEAAPATIDPVPHPDGWVGLSEGEGQDAVKAWWVRSRPGTPEDHGWDFTACFAGDLLITKLIGYVADNERLVAIDAAGTQHDLGEADGWLLPAADGTWLSVTPTTIQRCRAIRA